MKVVSFKKQAELTVLIDSIGKQQVSMLFFKSDKGTVLFEQLSNINARPPCIY